MSDRLIRVVEYKYELSRPQGPLQMEGGEAAVKRFIEELRPVDLASEPRFVILTHRVRLPEEQQTQFRRSETYVSYINLFGHSSGVFVEVRYTRPGGIGSPVAPIGYCPTREGPRSEMARIWVGQHYRRVPLEFLVTKEEALEVVRHFMDTKGELWPGLHWSQEETLDWQLRLSPEDDYYHPDEPATRPASQQSLALEQVIETLRPSYLRLGFDVDQLFADRRAT
ncbi:MAG: hypothetical protein ACTHK7_03480 [Aureliella sp.]